MRSKSKLNKLIRANDGKYRVRDQAGNVHELQAERWLRFWQTDRVIVPYSYEQNGSGHTSRCAALRPDYVLVADETGQLVPRRKLLPEPSARIKTWWETFFAQWLRHNPDGRYTTMEDVRRAIAEEFWQVG